MIRVGSTDCDYLATEDKSKWVNEEEGMGEWEETEGGEGREGGLYANC